VRTRVMHVALGRVHTRVRAALLARPLHSLTARAQRCPRAARAEERDPAGTPTTVVACHDRWMPAGVGHGATRARGTDRLASTFIVGASHPSNPLQPRLAVDGDAPRRPSRDRPASIREW